MNFTDHRHCPTDVMMPLDVLRKHQRAHFIKISKIEKTVAQNVIQVATIRDKTISRAKYTL